MFDFLVPLTVYKPIFMLELIFAVALVTERLKRQPHFRLRAVSSILGLLAVSVLFPVIWYNSIYISCMFLLLFACLLAAMRFCFDEPWINVLFYGIIAYTAQHISYQTHNFLMTISGLGKYGEMYLEAAYDGTRSVFAGCLSLVCICLVYWPVWLITSYMTQTRRDLDFGNRRSRLLLAFALLLVDVVLNAVEVYGIGDAILPSVTLVVMYMQSVLCCVMALGIQFTMLDKATAVRETERIKELWRLDRELYERFQESAELINIKCHDLKHQLQMLQTAGGKVTRQELGDMAQAIAVFDNQIQTGNQVLDTVLALKGLECEYAQIHFTCIAEGQVLEFLSVEQLYSLFGNAMTNAIEAVKKSDDQDKRVIHLEVARRKDLVFIHVENYCPDAGQLTFMDGLPETTKTDRINHGYGMRSMQLITEQLGGGMEVHVEKSMFHLNIFIPAAKKETGADDL